MAGGEIGPSSPTASPPEGAAATCGLETLRGADPGAVESPACAERLRMDIKIGLAVDEAVGWEALMDAWSLRTCSGFFSLLASGDWNIVCFRYVVTSI